MGWVTPSRSSRPKMSQKVADVWRYASYLCTTPKYEHTPHCRPALWIVFCRIVYELLFIVFLFMNYCLLYFYLWIIVIVYSLSFSLYYLWILSNVYWKPFYLWKWEISLITGNEENIKTTIASLTWVFHPGSAWDSGTQPIF